MLPRAVPRRARGLASSRNPLLGHVAYVAHVAHKENARPPAGAGVSEGLCCEERERLGSSSYISAWTRLDLADVARLHLAVLALGDLELDLLTLVEGLEALTLDLAEVDEHVVAVLLGDEAIALVGVEPLHG